MQYGLDIAKVIASSTAAFVLSSYFRATESSQVSRVGIRSPRVVRWQLTNHDRVVAGICLAHEGEIRDMLKNQKEVFVVVGLLIATDVEMMDEHEDRRAIDVGVSIGVSVTGVDVPLAGAPLSRALGES